MLWRRWPNNFIREVERSTLELKLSTSRVFGKRGENPPLPRNCKRGEFGPLRHWSIALGRRPELDEA